MDIVDFLHPAAWLAEHGGPRCAQLRQRLEEGILAGRLAPNASLPPERDLAGITGLSRVTVRKAIHELVREGPVEQRQGSGTFIREPVARAEQSLSRLTSFSEEMAQRGMTTTAKRLERGLFAPTERESAVLGPETGEEEARISRLREVAGRPEAIERASLPRDILPSPLKVKASLYKVLARRGLGPVRAVQKITAISIDADAATLLDLAEGAAARCIERRAVRESGRVAQLTRALFRGDACQFVAELQI